MKVRSPNDLPDFRLWLMDQWRPGGDFDRMAELHRDAGADPNVTTEVTHLDPHVEPRNLPKASLWWVSSEMATLVDHASATLPPTTLTHELIPDVATPGHGLVVFAEPLTGIDSQTGGALHVDAMSWSLGKRIIGFSGEVITIVTYCWETPDGVAHLEPLTPQGYEIGAVVLDRRTEQLALVSSRLDAGPRYCPIGMSDWVVGADTETPIPGMEKASEDRLASISEDRRWLAALWLLASQPLAESSTTKVPRPAARRSQRRNVTSDVRLVNVRRAHTPREPSEVGEHGKHREYSHRFIVGGEGGFWRQQACGPNWSQHRPVWIAPFIKGPPDKPLKIRDTVHVVTEDPR